jgi:hypothetical protein
MVDFTTALALLKTVTDTSTSLLDLSKHLRRPKDKEAELKQAELNLKIVTLVNHVTQLTGELNQLKEKLAVRAAMNFVSGLCWKNDEPNDPYCARCFEVDGKAVHLHRSGPHHWWCYGCKTKLVDPTNPPPAPPAPRAPMVHR